MTDFASDFHELECEYCGGIPARRSRYTGSDILCGDCRRDVLAAIQAGMPQWEEFEQPDRIG